MRDDGRVDYLERDGTMHAVAQTLPWGINKIDAELSPTAAITGDGADLTNVNAYIIDTGIDKTHPDLNVVSHVNFAGVRTSTATAMAPMGLARWPPGTTRATWSVSLRALR